MDFKAESTTGESLLMLLIKRDADDFFYDFNDSTFKAAGWTDIDAIMVEISAAVVPGEYEYSVDVSAWADGTYSYYFKYTGSPAWITGGEFRLVDGKEAVAITGELGTTAKADVNIEADAALSDYDPPTRAELTTDKDSIITEVNGNETKIDTIDVIVDTILDDTNELQSLISSSKIAAQIKGIDNDMITAAVFDESTAFPLKSADTGTTQVARTGADGDTLETLSDQMDLIHTVTTLVNKWISNKLVFTGTSMILYDDNGTTPLKTWTISQGTLTIAAPYNRAAAS